MAREVRPHPRVVTTLASATGAATAAHLVLIMLGDRVSSTLRDGVVFNVPYAVAVAALAWAAHHSRLRGRSWGAWAWFGAGMAAQLAANLYYTLVLSGMADPPYPSWSDVGYLIYYPELYVGLILLVRSKIAHWRPSLWFDGVISYLALAAVVVQVGLGPLVDLAGGRVDVALVNLAYPLGDVLLLALVLASTLLLGARRDRQWLLLILGMAAMAVADIAYSVLDSAGLYVEGNPIDIAYVASATLVALAGLREVGRGPFTPAEISTSRLSRWALLAVPTGSGLVALATLAPVTAWEHVRLAEWLALGALAAAIVRVLLSYREIQATTTARLQAQTDELTGLTNRRGFFTLGAPLVAEATRLADPGRGVPGAALLLLDLDGFKDVNDSLGHATGDRLLVEVAHRLRETLRGPDDLLVRLGGDEFAAILPRADLRTAVATTERLRTALAKPLTLGAIPVRIQASIGVALAPDHGADLAALLSRADIAMYRAKTSGHGLAVFNPNAGDRDDERRFAHAAVLREAVTTGRLMPSWSEVRTVADGRLIAREVQVTLRLDDGVLDTPALHAEAAALRLLPELTAATLELALAAMTCWPDERPVPAVVPVPSEALAPGLVTLVTDLLAQHGLAGDRLVLAVGEAALLSDRDRATTTLSQLHALGVHWSLTGFGAADSVLGYLAGLPIDTVTLDSGLLAPAAEDPDAARLVRTAASLLHQLDIAVVAAPAPAVRERLGDLGCDLAVTPDIGTRLAGTESPVAGQPGAERVTPPAGTQPAATQARARTATSAVPSPERPRSLVNPSSPGGGSR